ncbi:MAG: carbohydrate binding domain-containing protein, partial [Candidatus Izemoplasmatales bacterium]|nr:carbohydrate binding domain-containing protein [Candidatus Izemoplasmatales bacterium]
NSASAERTLRVLEALLTEFYIVNGDFEDPLEEPWGHWAGEGGASSVEIVEGVLQYHVTAVGNLTYSNQFSQVDRLVETGKIYQLSFKAKADDVRPMIVQLERRTDYTRYWTTTVDLTTDWVTYTFAFEVTLPTTDAGKLGFFLGNIGTTSVATTVYLDDIVITELEELPGDHTAPVMTGLTPYVVEVGIPFDPLAGVSVQDDYDTTLTVNDIEVTGTLDINTVGEYTLTYTVEDESGNIATATRTITVSTTPPASVFVVPNPDFSTDQASSSSDGWLWKTGGDNTAQFNAEITGGQAVIQVSVLGNVSYGVQFYLLNRSIEQGRTYRISFDAKVDNPTPIQVVFENASYVRQFDHTFDLTTTMTTYTFEYFHANASMNNGKFGFFLGLVNSASVPTTFYIDNIVIEAIPTIIDTEAPEITGADDITIEVGTTFDALYGIDVTDDRDLTLRVTDITIDGLDTLDTAVVGEYTLTYTITDASGNSVTVTRIVTVQEGIAPSTWVVVNGDFSKDQYVPVTDDGWYWKTSTGGAFTAKIVNGVAEINVTNPGLVPHGVQFYQTNRVTVTDTYYVITFKAKADMPRPIKVILENGSTYARLMDYDVMLTTEWQTYTIEFHYAIDGITNAKFGFFLGAVLGTSVPTTIYLDDVNIVTAESITDTQSPTLVGVQDETVLQGSTFDPMLGVKVWDFQDKVLSTTDVTVTGTVDTATVGDYLLTYSLTDASGNTASYTRTISVVAAMPFDSSFTLVNGNMDIDQPESLTTNGWYWKTSGTGAFTAAISGGVAAINVTALGTATYGVQFFQQDRILEEGAIYKISFKAKADIARPIQMAIEGSASSTTRLYDTIFDLTTEWATYETTVTFSNVFGFTNGKFAFFLGLVGTTSVPTTIYFDDVVIEQIGVATDTSDPILVGITDADILVGDTFDVLAGVSVFDIYDKSLGITNIVVTGDQVSNTEGVYSFDSSVAGTYTVTYTLTEQSGNETVVTRTVVVRDTPETSVFVIPNGDFSVDQLESDLAGWSWKTSTGGAFTLAIQNGQVEVHVTSIGDVPHGVQLNLLNRTIHQGDIYKITFTAKADDPRPIKMVVENGSTYARLFDIDTYLTGDWVTYTYYFVYNSPSITNAKFAFFMGAVLNDSVPTDIYLDDITVELVNSVVDTMAPVIYGVDDTLVLQGEVFNPMLGVSPWDNFDKSLLPAHIKVTGTVDTDTVGDYTLTYSVRDSYGNVGTFTRVVSVVATLPASAWTLVNGDMEIDQAASVTENGWYWKISGTGAFTAEVADGIATINVTALGTVPYGVQFFQQNRTIESGSIYKITFMAKADIARPIQMAVEGGISSTTRLYDEIFNLTTDWVTYTTYVCLPKSATFVNGKFAFFLGLVGTTSVETTIYFDNITIEQVGMVKDTTAPFIVGATDVAITAGDTFDPMAGILVDDVYDGTLNAGDIVVTGDQISVVADAYVFDSSTAGVYTITYTLTDKSGNETVVTRSVTVN